MTLTTLAEVTPGQQIVLDVEAELVTRVELDGDHVTLTYHDGRRSIPLPGSLKVAVQGAQLMIVEEQPVTYDVDATHSWLRLD